MRNKYYSLAFLFVVAFLASCQTIQVQTQFPEIKLEGTEQSRNYFSLERKYQETFRIFSSSKHYFVQQYQNQETIRLKEDKSGDAYFQKQLLPFDRIDYFGYLVAKMELYQDSGKISRIRLMRSSGIQQLDELILKDILRFQFQFPQKKVLPRIFYIGYAVNLKR